MTKIVANAYDPKSGRLTVSIDKDPSDTLGPLEVDEIVKPGQFVSTVFGWLYKHTDGEWGLPGLGYGAHTVEASYSTLASGVTPLSAVMVGNPPSTLGTERVFPPQNLIPFLWAAGFRGETGLLYPLSIAVGESGLYNKARNWLPSSGFRPVGTTIGVTGPDAAWNSAHTQQGHSDRGLFQINSKAWPQYTDAECDDPAQACKTIFAMSKGATNWTPWGFGAGADHYSQFWDQASHGFPALRPLVQAFLTTPTR